MDTKGSKGLLDEMMAAAGEIEKNNSSNAENKKSNLEELNNSILEEKKIKSGYRLRESTLAKLNEMKVFLYPPRTSYEDIVDEAICKLYESKKQG
jgi:hypothetical protein